MQRDGLDFGKMNIPALFGKMFVPTLLGMMLMSTITIADGAMVGQGVGSDALAAVNIVAPFFLITTGVGLMFGSGASIVASVHLAQGRKKAADINITQAFIVSTLLMLVLAVVCMVFMEPVAKLLGSSQRLLPYVKDYMFWVIPGLPLGMLMSIGMFVIRMDGSPIYAMLCNAVPGAVNVVLDYLFIFPMDMGIGGAALASTLAQASGAIMVIIYMFCRTSRINFYRLKLSSKSLMLTLRNIGYQVKLGASGLIGELAIACMMFVGNYAFIRFFGEDGVAAFSVACYCFPLVFMIGNAIAQSAQPIISYNYGAGFSQRVTHTFRLSLLVAAVCGAFTTLCGIFEADIVISLFIPDSSSQAYIIAHKGFPLFSTAFVLFALNLVLIGYLQSIENFQAAVLFMLLRGAVLVIPAFLFMPQIIGWYGLWFAVPVSELFTLISVLVLWKKWALSPL